MQYYNKKTQTFLRNFMYFTIIENSFVFHLLKKLMTWWLMLFGFFLHHESMGEVD